MVGFRETHKLTNVIRITIVERWFTLWSYSVAVERGRKNTDKVGTKKKKKKKKEKDLLRSSIFQDPFSELNPSHRFLTNPTFKQYKILFLVLFFACLLACVRASCLFLSCLLSFFLSSSYSFLVIGILLIHKWASSTGGLEPQNWTTPNDTGRQKCHQQEVVIARRKQPLGNVKSAGDQKRTTPLRVKKQSVREAERSARRTRRMEVKLSPTLFIHILSTYTCSSSGACCRWPSF
jgi:hypothetical protein